MKKYIFLGLLICGCLLFSLGLAEGLSIHFLNVEHGDSIIVQCEGETLVIDGGKPDKSSLLFSYLTKTLKVEEVQTLILTHPHEDHVGGLPAVFKAAAVKRVLSSTDNYDSKPFRSFQKAVEKGGLSIEIPKGNLHFSLGSAEIEIYAPLGNYTDLNNTSLITKINYKDATALLMGDALLESEAELLESGFTLKADLLKLGHHGKDNATSPIFLGAVRPQYAILSGKKLPKEALLFDTIRDKNISLYHTAVHGHIVAKSNGQGFAISVQKNADKSAILATPTPKPQKTEKLTIDNAPYIGNRNTKKFHYYHCRSVYDMKDKNKVPLSSAEEATRRGFVPCKRCEP